jgi:hypothetical protein
VAICLIALFVAFRAFYPDYIEFQIIVRIYCVGAGFPRPIARVTNLGGEKGAPTLHCAVAFNFQRPSTPVEDGNDCPVAAATVDIVVSSSLHSTVAAAQTHRSATTVHAIANRSKLPVSENHYIFWHRSTAMLYGCYRKLSLFAISFSMVLQAVDAASGKLDFTDNS